MAIATNELLDEGKCYACFGELSVAQILELALLRRMLLISDPDADTSPQVLYEYGKCYACLGISSFEILKLALLDQLAQAA